MTSKLDHNQIEKRAAQMLNDLLAPVDLSAVVTYDERTRKVYIGGEAVDDGKLQNLKAEAEFLAKSDIWKLIYETPKALAERAMFVNGETIDDIRKGRSILYALSTQKKIMDTFASFTPKQPIR